MTDPLFWLVLSLLFVTASLTIVLIVAIPALKELGRAARSAEKLFDTLRREFPPTLEAIRLTGLEISDLTDDISEGVQSAGQVVKQVDQTLSGARKQARKVHLGTRSFVAGIRTAWKTFSRPQPPRRSGISASPNSFGPTSPERLPSSRMGNDSRNPLRERPTLQQNLPEERSRSQDSGELDSADAGSLDEMNETRFISKAGEVLEQTSLPDTQRSRTQSPKRMPELFDQVDQAEDSLTEDSYRDR